MKVLGGGHYEYKTNSKAVSTITYTGNIPLKKHNIFSRLLASLKKGFSIRVEIDRWYNRQIITILGIKIKIKKEFTL